MRTHLQAAKATLREQVRQRLKSILPEARAIASAQARARLVEQTIWRRANSVLLFAPLPQEVDIWPLLTAALAAGKLVALPCFEPDSRIYAARQVGDPETDVQVGRFGIREPMEHCGGLPGDKIDLVLVPGVAFDLEGNRLGRGQGYYDQLLATLPGSRCGIAFDQQIEPGIPAEEHDASMNCLLTPTRWIELRR
jgi:5-formyltetrahydrofolate cyclo-ligase